MKLTLRKNNQYRLMHPPLLIQNCAPPQLLDLQGCDRDQSQSFLTPFNPYLVFHIMYTNSKISSHISPSKHKRTPSLSSTPPNMPFALPKVTVGWDWMFPKACIPLFNDNNHTTPIISPY